MKLTEEQIEFLDKVCGGRETWTLNSEGKVDVECRVDMNNMNLTEIPVKFGRVDGFFNCSGNQLTSLEFAPSSIVGDFYCSNNPLKEYFKNLKEEDFPHWDKLWWNIVLEEYPFLINICKKFVTTKNLKECLTINPPTKLYLK